MNTTNMVLDRLQKELDLPSGYAIAKVLGVTKTAIYDYRGNKRNLSDEVAKKAAKLLKMDEFELLCNLRKDRASSDFEKEVWERMIKLNDVANVLKKHEVKHLFADAANDSPTLKKAVDNLEECILCKIANFHKNTLFYTPNLKLGFLVPKMQVIANDDFCVKKLK